MRSPTFLLTGSWLLALSTSCRMAVEERPSGRLVAMATEPSRPRYYDPAQVVRLDAPVEGEAFGGAGVAIVGDVDGDGFGDLVVGAPLADGTGTDAGAVYLFPGTAEGVSPTPSAVLEGAAGARIGAVLEPAGDVDGDGRSDLLLTAGDGILALHLAADGAFAPVADWTGDLAEIGSHASGDFDGDGYTDLALAVEGKGGDTISVHEGGPDGLAAEPGQEFDLGSYTSDPLVVFTAGDVDGDGVDDLGITTEDLGLVLPGAGAGLDPSNPVAWYTDLVTDTGTRLNFNGLRSAGDPNGDGAQDLRIGIWTFIGTDWSYGYWLDADPNVLPAYYFLLGRRFTASFWPQGDLDGDGYDDLQAWTDDDETVVYGGQSDLTAMDACVLDLGGLWFEGLVGDLNGDAAAEAWIVDPLVDTTDGGPGYVDVHFGYPSDGTACADGGDDTGDTGDGGTDGGTGDGGTGDGGTGDGGTGDGGTGDGGTGDGGTGDGGTGDGGTGDGGTGDGGTGDGGQDDSDDGCGCGAAGGSGGSPLAVAVLGLLGWRRRRAAGGRSRHPSEA